MAKTILGIIGGSGIYDLPELADAEWRNVDSPWGEASDAIRTGTLNGLDVAFLPRHGRGHVVPPSDINYRANIDVLKRIGVTDLISISACGSLKQEHEPGHFIIVEQYIDRTRQRPASFFGKGCVAHASMAFPTSPEPSKYLATALEQLGINYCGGATYLAMEGPQFSTKAESELYRSWGADVLGMTNMPEARLAREAEITYASVCMVTDYDCWHPEYGEVNIPKVMSVLRSNSENAKKVILKLSEIFPREHPVCPMGTDCALEYAIITPPHMRDPELVAKLDAVAGRVLKK